MPFLLHPEPICERPRDLQTVPRDPTNLSARVKTHTGCLCPGHPAFQYRTRPPGRLQAILAGVGGTC